jgi:hypothetical protein
MSIALVVTNLLFWVRDQVTVGGTVAGLMMNVLIQECDIP